VREIKQGADMNKNVVEQLANTLIEQMKIAERTGDLKAESFCKDVYLAIQRALAKWYIERP